MKYFKSGNEIRAFEDTVDHSEYISSEYIEISEQDALATLTHPPLSVDQQAVMIDNAVEAHIEATAKAKGYRNADRCVSYAGYPNQYQAECLAFAYWRTDCFAYVIQETNKVKAGTRSMPTIEEVILELPVMVWIA